MFQKHMQRTKYSPLLFIVCSSSCSISSARKWEENAVCSAGYFFLSILPSVFAVYVDILIHSPPCWARLDLILSNIDIQGEVKTIGWAADCSKGCLTTMQKFKKQPRFCYKCLSLLMFLDFEISRRQTWRNWLKWKLKLRYVKLTYEKNCK